MSHNSLPAGLSIVVPVYNSGPALRLLYDALVDVLEVDIAPGDAAALQGQLSAHRPFELILVEDHGQDDSWAVIQSLSRRDPRVIGLRMNRNFGQHSALLCGIRAARYDTVVTMDDDLQHRPQDIAVLLRKLVGEVDVVYGVPAHEQHGLLRDMASKLTKAALASAMGHKAAQHVSAFRVFRTQLRAAFAGFNNPSVSIDVLLSWATTGFDHVVVEHQPRRFGESNYTLRKLVKHALNMATGFGITPLHFATWMGFAFTAVGFLLFLYVFGRGILFGSPVQGFPFLGSMIAMFSGVQLLSLGIIGEYIGRIFERTGQRPAYFVTQSTQAEQAPAAAAPAPTAASDARYAEHS
jgi:glycosyltransferase involved in cell wall biosynthesis